MVVGYLVDIVAFCAVSMITDLTVECRSIFLLYKLCCIFFCCVIDVCFVGCSELYNSHNTVNENYNKVRIL